MARGAKRKNAAAPVKLRRSQAAGVRFLLRQPLGGLAWDPGVGKTLTTLSAFLLLKEKRLINVLLVVAPLRVATREWTGEIAKWRLPLKVVMLHGPRKDERLLEPADVYVLNYDGLGWFADNWKLWYGARLADNRRWLVLDESTKVKHTNTQRFKTLRPLLYMFGRRTILTGTPMPNGLLDLFGQVFCLDLGASLGRWITQYRRAYFYPSGYGGYDWQPQADAEERIFQVLRPLLHRVSEAELDLPPRHDVQVLIELPPKARKLYDELEREFLVKAGDGKVLAKNAGVLGSKLRQVAGGAVYDQDGVWRPVHDAKLEAVGDLVEQLQGNPLLIGYEFNHEADRLIKYLNVQPMLPANRRHGEVYPLVRGGVGVRRANELFDHFNRRQLPVLLVQWEAGKFGLNLQQACHHVALFGMPWDLETYIQFVRRVRRGGQTRPVTVHHFLGADTRDERVFRVVTEVKNPTQNRLLKALAGN